MRRVIQDGKTGKDLWNGHRKQICRGLLMAAVVIVLGFAVDLVMQREVLMLPQEEQGLEVLDLSLAEGDGFERTGEGLLLTEENGMVAFTLGGRFINRFLVSYEWAGRMNVIWQVWLTGKEEPVVIEDCNSSLISTSVEYLNANVERVELRWQYADGMTEDGEVKQMAHSMELVRYGEEETAVISGAAVRNEFSFNWHRILFVWTALGLALFLWCGRKWMAVHFAGAYLITALSLGALMIVLLPANKVSWDEEMHFFHAYCVSHFGTEVTSNEMLEELFVADEANWPFNLPANRDERREMNETLNRLVDEEERVFSRGRALAGIYTPAYLAQGLGFRLGRILRLPFTVCYQLGRFFNLLFCSVIMALAIWRIPFGKAILAVIGLMPEPLLLMSVYSYDAFITSLLALGFACFLYEYVNRDKKVSWRNFAGMALCFFVGSMPKAIYVPLILCIFALPHEKFASRRQEMGMKGITLILFLVLMASFVLPTVLSPAETNDLRGGNTSEAGQIPYILSDIPRFLNMLISSIAGTFASYTIGEAVFSSMAHLGAVRLGILITPFVLFVLLADEKSHGAGETRSLTWPVRGFILLLCNGIIAMVWVAMYLAFTPVGMNQINGVQARYYLPVLLPVYLCLWPEEMKIRVQRQTVYFLALGGTAAISAIGVGWTMI